VASHSALFFSFWSIHYIGEELEQPFGDDVNDLPLRDMQTDMNKSLVSLMSQQARNPPACYYEPGAPPEIRLIRLHLGTDMQGVTMKWISTEHSADQSTPQRAQDVKEESLCTRNAVTGIQAPPPLGKLWGAMAVDEAQSTDPCIIESEQYLAPLDQAHSADPPAVHCGKHIDLPVYPPVRARPSAAEPLPPPRNPPKPSPPESTLGSEPQPCIGKACVHDRTTWTLPPKLGSTLLTADLHHEAILPGGDLYSAL